jgi:hypothetical protein
MRALLMGFALLATAACGPRQVEVGTGAATQAEVMLNVRNNFSQAVSVYVVQGGNPMFVKLVAANAQETVPVPGVAAGSTVTLRATLADGSRTVEKSGVTLNGTYSWTLP